MELLRLNHESVLKLLPDRDRNAHKGDFGKILLLCGSRGYTGAAALASMGALRVGAGLVFLGVPECIYEIEAIKLNEPIVFPVSDKNGMFSDKAIMEIGPRLEEMDAVLIGPGIGKSPDCRDLVSWLLETFKGPIVLDADGINVIAKHKDMLRGRTGVTILTPHAGEFSRLSGTGIDNRQKCAESLAEDLGVIVALKGNGTVVTDGKTTYINDTGNPGMAVGGSGDILAGMIVGLVGQGISALEATAASVWLHGRAGDVCADNFGQYGMLPSDMLNILPQLLK